jgi:hypothetical protein
MRGVQCRDDRLFDLGTGESLTGKRESSRIDLDPAGAAFRNVNIENAAPCVYAGEVDKYRSLPDAPCGSVDRTAFANQTVRQASGEYLSDHR